MREILFRGKEFIGSIYWYYGFAINREDKWYVTDGTEESDTGESFVPTYDYEVAPETIGQYIGVTDINANKIFEGDIVKVTPTESQNEVCLSGYCFVSYEERFACFVLVGWQDGHRIAMTLSAFVNSTLEVMGNIYDDPHLLDNPELLIRGD